LEGITTYVLGTAIPEENQFILTRKQNRGNCTLKSFDILLRFTAQLLHPETMIFNGSENVAKKAYKFWTEKRIDRSLEPLANFVVRGQNAREDAWFRGQPWQEPPFFNESVVALEKVEAKANQKLEKKIGEGDITKWITHEKRAKNVKPILDFEKRFRGRNKPSPELYNTTGSPVFPGSSNLVQTA
jgi:hypothetical protein